MVPANHRPYVLSDQKVVFFDDALIPLLQVKIFLLLSLPL